MRKISVGDRVRVLGYCTLGKDIDGQKGVLIKQLETGNVMVQLEQANHCVKISQCRKLVKRPPKFYWIGKVRHSDDKFLWIPLVAHTHAPTGVDAEGKPFVKVRAVKA